MTSTYLRPSRQLISEGSRALRLLNGVVCLYKPLGYGNARNLKEFRNKICGELNQMSPPPREERVEIHRLDKLNKDSRIQMENETTLLSFPDGVKQIEVVKGLSYTDHPLIIGNRYVPEDIKMIGTGPTSSEISGVHLFGLNSKGKGTARRIFHSRWLRTYVVSGRFGIATDTLFHTGRIVEKSTYSNIREQMFEKYLQSLQASHQKMSFQAAGVPMDSDLAFELASQGLVRPANASHPVVYSIKLINFQPPNFTLEMKVINEEFEYLKRLVHDIGLKLHSTAVCTQIRCTQVGPFGIEHALLKKHWSMEHVLRNMTTVGGILNSFDLWKRNPLASESLASGKLVSWEDLQADEEEDGEEEEEEEEEAKQKNNHHESKNSFKQ